MNLLPRPLMKEWEKLSKQKPGRKQDRPAIKTATLTMGGVRVQSPYKQLMGCNKGRCGVG